MNAVSLACDKKFAKQAGKKKEKEKEKKKKPRGLLRKDPVRPNLSPSVESEQKHTRSSCSEVCPQSCKKAKPLTLIGSEDVIPGTKPWVTHSKATWFLIPS